MDQQKILSIVILLAIIISLYVFFTKPLWLEPDSTAFFNRACLGGSDFETPILSRAIFDLLPCNEFAWKIFHVLLIGAMISSIYYFGKKHLKEKELFAFSFLSYFLLLFILQIEDDQIAFPLIVVLTARLLDNPTWSKRIGYVAAMIFLTLLVWKGAYVPMIITLGYVIHPLLAVLIPSAYIIYNFIITGQIGFFDPGKTAELETGAGFLQNDIPLLLLLFAKEKKKRIKENWDLFLYLTGFNILTFFYPKFGYWIFLPLLLLVEKFFPEENRKQWLAMAGIVALVIAPAMILYNHEPNPKTWMVIEKAVVLQQSGERVYNEWWVGRWFFYKGGKPSSEGGSSGEQIIDGNYYWLGSHRKECVPLESAGVLRLEKCSNPK